MLRKIIILFVVIALFLLCILPYVLFRFAETERVAELVLHYFLWPVLVIALLACILVYRKPLKSKKKRLKAIRNVFMSTIGITMVSLVIIHSLILITNAYPGCGNKEIQLNAVVTDSYTSQYKAQRKYYIVIKDEQLGREVKLQVSNQYKPGAVFNRTMKIGRWGLLYD